MLEGRKMGVVILQNTNRGLQANLDPDFPGTDAWLKGAGKTFDELNPEKPSDDWRKLDADVLVTGNPAFWQMYYEVLPGDAGIYLLHASALLAAGDAYRTDFVLRIICHSNMVDERNLKYLVALFRASNKFKEDSLKLVSKGIEEHDAGAYDKALTSYQSALSLWPRNGFAHYELGHTLRTKDNSPTSDAPEVVKAFAQARRFQPMQRAAWQGETKDVPGLQAMHVDVLSLWEKSLESLDYRMSDKELERFCAVLQEAQLDDLALISRQVLIQRRGNYAPADHPFITTSLRRLVPGKETEATLAKLNGNPFSVIQLYTPKTEGKPEKGESPSR
jgi:tetratricopeptide (TPR) repeat protein